MKLILLILTCLLWTNAYAESAANVASAEIQHPRDWQIAYGMVDGNKAKELFMEGNIFQSSPKAINQAIKDYQNRVIRSASYVIGERAYFDEKLQRTNRTVKVIQRVSHLSLYVDYDSKKPENEVATAQCEEIASIPIVPKKTKAEAVEYSCKITRYKIN